MSNIVALKCPSCAGNIELNSDHEFGFCVFCGTRIYIPNAVQRIKGTVSIDNSSSMNSHMVLANRALNIGNFAEAANHYEQCLIIDPDNPNANLKKGICALASITPQSHDLRHLKVYGARAFSELIQEGGYRPIADTLILLDTAMHTAFVDAASAQYQAVNKSTSNKKELSIANQQTALLSGMLDEAIASVKPLLCVIGTENASAPLVSETWGVFCNNMKEMGDHLRKAGVLNANHSIDDLLNALPSADLLKKLFNQKQAYEYWSKNSEEYNYLQQKKRQLEQKLSQCGILDLSKKKQIKQRLVELDNQIRFPLFR